MLMATRGLRFQVVSTWLITVLSGGPVPVAYQGLPLGCTLPA